MKTVPSSVLALLGLSLLVSCTSAFVPIHGSTTCRPFMASTPRHAVEEESAAVEESASGDETTMSDVVVRESKPAVKCPDCDLCDGSGRIIGGIGVVLDWWPIKAYRPCPNFIERGGRYVRSGQGLDEIAFGRDSTFNPDDL
eukprot:CAMPEP_0197440526 /NCGR_PEP_ID=MMETSP1175-20131217/7015_1 /TAXON_ID=1003142 /ORGANISM="Triceratium dubium, Strain CCMP147" /LENGTH=141 /DNA_ID=CAMNT_0042970653 /DNA_START=45 /DNA_END=470 /DNA_ORIENTATION=-